MAALSTYSNILKDPLIRGLALATTLLIGLCLEQSLLNQPVQQKITISFLIGNLIGYPLAVWSWQVLYPHMRLPLYSWLAAAFLVAFFSIYPLIQVALLLGLLFPFLMLHLYLLLDNDSSAHFSSLLIRVGLGISLGNLLIFSFEKIPYPLGIIWLSLALGGWRIKRPYPNSERPTGWFRFEGSYVSFLAFVFCFYTIGGLYYRFLGEIENSHVHYFADCCYLLYVAGIGICMLISKFHARFAPFVAIAIMGYALLFMMPPSKVSHYAIGVMEVGFGIMDCFSVAFILSQAATLWEAGVGLAVFPLSLLLSGFIMDYFVQGISMDLKWGLSFLFLTLLPLGSFSITNQRRKAVKVPALPPPLPGAAITANIEKGYRTQTSAHHAADKGVVAPPEIAAMAKAMGLTKREKEVFVLLLQGKKLKDIAKELGLALGSIKALSSRVYEKAGVKGRKGLLEQINKSSLQN